MARPLALYLHFLHFSFVFGTRFVFGLHSRTVHSTTLQVLQTINSFDSVDSDFVAKDFQNTTRVQEWARSIRDCNAARDSVKDTGMSNISSLRHFSKTNSLCNTLAASCALPRINSHKLLKDV